MDKKITEPLEDYHKEQAPALRLSLSFPFDLSLMSISRSNSNPLLLGILPNNFIPILVMMELNNCQ